MYHKPVLVREVLEYLAPKPRRVYLDVTFGGGGHTRAILEAEPTCSVIALDWDAKALELNRPALEAEFPGRFRVLLGNFANVEHTLAKNKISYKFDGILADFGTSQFQIMHKAGFSFTVDTELDMRMSHYYQTTAADIVNRASEKELIYIFTEYGQEPYARKIARAILESRRLKKFKTTEQLVTCITDVIPVYRDKIHPATRVFQALRIVVNHELDNINSFLIQALRLLKPEGRLVCISFHSLEDRLVKQFIQQSTGLDNLTRKVITAQPDELKENPSSRSAKLRGACKRA